MGDLDLTSTKGVLKKGSNSNSAENLNSDLSTLKLPKAEFKANKKDEISKTLLKSDDIENDTLVIDNVKYTKLEVVKRAKELGYEIKINDKIELSDFPNFKSGIPELSYIIGTPANLRCDVKERLISPFEIKKEYKEDGLVEIKVYDHLCEPAKEIYTGKAKDDKTIYTPDSIIPSEAKVNMYDLFKDKIIPAVTKQMEVYNKELSEIKENSELIKKCSFGFELKEKDVNSKTALDRKVLDKIITVGFTIQPHGDFDPKHVVINSQMLKDKSILIDGFIERIDIKLKPDLKSGALSRFRPGNIKLSNYEEDVPKEEDFVDSNGNTIHILKGDYKYVISIQPQIKNLLQNTDDNLTIPFKLDLTKVDLGMWNDLIETPKLSVRQTNLGTKIHSRDHDQLISKFGADKINQIEAGAMAACQAFGIKGQLKDIVFIDANHRNAYYLKNNKESILILDEILSESSENLFRIGFHEVAHLLDDLGSTQMSDGQTRNVWQDINIKNHTGNLYRTEIKNSSKKNDFFSELNESKFFKDGTGGHSGDNQSELFATMLVSLTNPSWHSKMLSSSSEFKNNYKKVLESVEQDIKNSNIISPNSPIMGEIRTRKEELVKMITPTNTISDSAKDLFKNLNDLKLPKFGSSKSEP